MTTGLYRLITETYDGTGPRRTQIVQIYRSIYMAKAYIPKDGLPDQKEQSKIAECVAYTGGSPERISVPAGMKRSPRRKGVSTKEVLSM